MTGIMGYLSMMTQGDFGKIKPEHRRNSPQPAVRIAAHDPPDQPIPECLED